MTNKVFLDDNFESYAKENGLGIFFKDDINKGYSSEGYFKDNKGFLNIRTNKEETAYYSDEITAETLMVKVYEQPWSSSTNETEVLDISDKLELYTMNTPIKAVQFSGTKKQKKKYHVESGGDGRFKIKTATGKQNIRVGDFIIVDDIGNQLYVVDIKAFALYFRKVFS